MADLARTIIASQTHRRTVDPMTFAKRARPFVIERVGMDPPEPKSPKQPEER